MNPAWIGLVIILIATGAGMGIGILEFGWRGKCYCGKSPEHGVGRCPTPGGG